MALNKSVFKTRALTAIIFAIVMLAGLLWNRWSFLLLFSIIHFGCWWEYLKLVEKIYRVSFHSYAKLGFMLIGYGLMTWFCSDTFAISGYVLNQNLSLPVSLAGFVLLAIGIFQKQIVKPNAFAVASIGLLYISLSWGMMIDLYDQITDIHVHDTLFVLSVGIIPVLIITSIWINDTMAYIVGSMIGKTPLSKISPKKTWEGTIGGIILSIVVVSLLSSWIILDTLDSRIIFFTASLAAISAVTGTAGDLLESKLKRMADVKDSGSLMPGHGGFLDRFDSLLLATPFVWLYLQLIIH